MTSKKQVNSYKTQKDKEYKGERTCLRGKSKVKSLQDIGTRRHMLRGKNNVKWWQDKRIKRLKLQKKNHERKVKRWQGIKAKEAYVTEEEEGPTYVLVPWICRRRQSLGYGRVPPYSRVWQHSPSSASGGRWRAWYTAWHILRKTKSFRFTSHTHELQMLSFLTKDNFQSLQNVTNVTRTIKNTLKNCITPDLS